MSEYVLVEVEEGATQTRSYLDSPMPPRAIVRHATQAFLTLSLDDPNASRDGVRVEMDLDTADKTAKAIRRALTEWRKRVEAPHA